jgi:hypothetical protein
MESLHETRTLGARLRERLQGGTAERREQAPAESEAAVERVYVVVHEPCVFLRERPDVTSRSAGIRFRGAEVRAVGEPKDGWLTLADGGGYVLADGRSLGLGPLLRPLPPPTARDELSKLPPLAVLAADGLCNRLRIVLSFATIARQRGRPLLVLWPVVNVCNGRFEDAFAPIEGVTFVEKLPAEMRAQFAPSSSDFHPDVKRLGEDACNRCFALLRPSEAVARRVDANLRALRSAQLHPETASSFISMHIRRTDHWGSEITDDDFAAFALRHPASSIFLATDNATTQA